MDWVEQLQKLVPWAARLPVLPKVLLSAALSSFLLLLLALIWAPVSEERMIPDRGGSGNARGPGEPLPNKSDGTLPEVEADSSSVAATAEVLRGCYTRAVFTRTHAEMSYPAMFDSILHCRELVQSQIPNVSNHDMGQQLANALGALDQIERICRQASPDPTRHLDLSDVDRARIDLQKLEVLRNLESLSRISKVPYLIPQTLTEEVFFSEKDANKPPTVR